mgnify:CR=1 FL=1
MNVLMMIIMSLFITENVQLDEGRKGKVAAKSVVMEYSKGGKPDARKSNFCICYFNWFRYS